MVKRCCTDPEAGSTRRSSAACGLVTHSEPGARATLARPSLRGSRVRAYRFTCWPLGRSIRTSRVPGEPDRVSVDEEAERRVSERRATVA